MTAFRSRNEAEQLDTLSAIADGRITRQEADEAGKPEAYGMRLSDAEMKQNPALYSIVNPNVIAL